jgi:NitT/TauT family transport system ATP-binding protein
MIKLEHISKTFGYVKVFDDFTLAFPEDKITVILGPSGCGKTTLLNILAGLKPVDQGVATKTEHVSYLFQEPRLLPWLTIRENIALVLKKKMEPSWINRQIREHLETIGLSRYADYYPSQLSGGMRQRAAMVRAFSYDAPLLLMDEPFKSLDVKMQFQLIRDFLTLWQQKKRTVITVTHDVQEALWLADEILVFPEKPVKTINKFVIGLPQAERTQDGRLADIEKKLLDLLLK